MVAAAGAADRLAREQITMTSLLTGEAFARPAPAGS
jgi:hypothetical protein